MANEVEEMLRPVEQMRERLSPHGERRTCRPFECPKCGRYYHGDGRYDARSDTMHMTCSCGWKCWWPPKDASTPRGTTERHDG